MSSRSISDSQSSAHVEHSPVVPHSSQSVAPHMSHDKSWSSGISFPQKEVDASKMGRENPWWTVRDLNSPVETTA